MHDGEMQDMGPPMLVVGGAYSDERFIHAGAIEMASVARVRSGIPELRSMTRSIIDSQAKEMGQLVEWRRAWYGTAL